MEKYLEKVSKKFTGILPYQKPVLPNRQVKEKLKNPCWTINPSGVSFLELSRAHTVSKITHPLNSIPVCDRQWDRQVECVCHAERSKVLATKAEIKPRQVKYLSILTGCSGDNALCKVHVKIPTPNKHRDYLLCLDCS